MDYSERPHTPTGKLPPYLASAMALGRYIGPGRTAKQDSRVNDQCKRYHAAQRKLAFWTRVTVAEAHKRGLARVRKYFAKMDNALEAFYSPRTDGDPLSPIISLQA